MKNGQVMKSEGRRVGFHTSDALINGGQGLCRLKNPNRVTQPPNPVDAFSLRKRVPPPSTIFYFLIYIY